MSMIETAVRGAQKLEMILEKKLGASGRGLHEKLTSVEHRLPPDLLRQARRIATLRNRVVHEGASIPDVARFDQEVQALVLRLEAMPVRAPSTAAGAAGPLFQSVAEETPSSEDEEEADGQLFRSTSGSRSHRRNHRLRGSHLGSVLAFMGIIAVFWMISLKGRGVDRPTEAEEEDTEGASSPAKEELQQAMNNIFSTKPGRSPVIPAKQDGPGPRADPQPGPVTHEIKGSLAALVKEPRVEPQVDIASAKREIDANVWAYLERNVKLSIGKYELESKGDGTHELRVPMSWSIDPQPLTATINKYYKGSSEVILLGKDLVVIERAGLEKKSQKGTVSDDLYQYLARKEARIRVSAGSYSGFLTIATGRAAPGKERFMLHLNNLDQPQTILLTSDQGEQNPVLVGRIKKADLASIGKISAVVEIVPASRSRR